MMHPDVMHRSKQCHQYGIHSKEEVATRGPIFLKYWEKWEDLVLIDGVLYYKSRWDLRVNKPLLVLPEKLRKGALRHLHDSRCGAHLGQEKTWERVRERYFWVGQHRDVIDWIKKCPKCIQKMKPSKKARPTMFIHNVNSPTERIGIDILGPLPVSDRGNRYVLCIGDYFSKWITSIPIPNQEASTVAQVLIDNIISVFGVPKQIHSDKGSNFESKLFSQLCHMLGVRKTRPTSFHPSENGFIERWNRTLQNSLKLYTHQNQRDWDLHIPYMNMTYRSSIQSSTGYTPNEVFLGRNVTLPVDLILGHDTDKSPPVDMTHYVENHRDAIHHVHCAVRNNNAKASAKQKFHHDKQSVQSKLNNSGENSVKFEVGDLVWYYRPAKKKGVCPKLQNFLEGPCEVLKVISPILFLVKPTGKRPMVVNVGKLKPYLTNEDANTILDFDPLGCPHGNSLKSDVNSQMPPLITKRGRTSRKPQWYGIKL